METLVLREERPSFNYLNDFGGFWKPGTVTSWLGCWEAGLEPTTNERQEYLSYPTYAVAIFHELDFVKNSGWLRVLWRQVYLPQIVAHRPRQRTDIMLEDEPIAPDYAGPKIADTLRSGEAYLPFPYAVRLLQRECPCRSV